MSEKKCSSWYLLVSGGTLDTWIVLQLPLSSGFTVIIELLNSDSA